MLVKFLIVVFLDVFYKSNLDFVDLVIFFLFIFFGIIIFNGLIICCFKFFRFCFYFFKLDKLLFIFCEVILLDWFFDDVLVISRCILI